ncbi:MAG: LuxR C-terminal-related transcriptional regulator [Chloroflexota bacterium]
MNVSNGLSEPILLLRTKLYPPQANLQFIQRPQLMDHLTRGLDRKLTLITAPAGYGKTTIVSQWLSNLRSPSGPLSALDSEQKSQIANAAIRVDKSAKRHHFVSSRSKIDNAALRPLRDQIAWLSLDEYDNDLYLFVRYLVAAIQTVWSDSCSSTLAALQNPQQAPGAYLANILINDLITLPEMLILVLDDYHFVKEQSIHQFLNRLLEHLPQFVHLVLISRTEPPLTLPQLRVRRQLSELRVADLSFSNAEAEQYLTQATGRTLAAETVLALQDRNEGWIAGLYLATLSLEDDASEQALVRHVQAGNVNILDYLFTEVLLKQSAAVQAFLLRTSILNRFCVSLGEALLEDDWLEMVKQDEPLATTIDVSHRPVQSIIEWLSRHHLFLIALDDEGEWYRYHHLFQLMLTRNLQKQIKAEEIAALHRKASRWLAKAGLIDESIQQALTGNEPSFAIRLIEEQRLNLLAQFDYGTLERWLALIPEHVTEENPKLLLLKCWIAVSLHRLTSVSVVPLLQQAEACLENPNTSLDVDTQVILQAEITALRGAVCFIHHEFERAMEYIPDALEVLPDSYVFMRALMLLYATISLQAMGKVSVGIELIQKEVQNEVAQFSLVKLWMQTYLPAFDYLAGNLHQAVQSAQIIVNRIHEQSNSNAFLLTVPCRWMGYIYYEWNELATAHNYSSQVDKSNSTPYFNSQLDLAWLYEVEGREDNAQEVVERLKRWAHTLENRTFDNEIASFQARCLYWQGKIDMALIALRDVEIIASKQGLFAVAEIPALTLVKVLLAHESESYWRDAEELLADLWLLADKAHNVPAKVKLLALKAMLYQRQGQFAEALANLEHSITLAKPGGFIRTFVDLGPPMAGLLYELLARGVEADYLGQILAAFPKTLQNDGLPQRIQQAAQIKLIEPLTPRESEILLLLEEGLPNKLIARDLDISDLTVKRHTINLYQKLGVNSRKQAVTRAKALGILSAD